MPIPENLVPWDDDDSDDVERCQHGLPFDEVCDACDDEAHGGADDACDHGVPTGMWCAACSNYDANDGTEGGS